MIFTWHGEITHLCSGLYNDVLHGMISVNGSMTHMAFHDVYNNEPCHMLCNLKNIQICYYYCNIINREMESVVPHKNLSII